MEQFNFLYFLSLIIHVSHIQNWKANQYHLKQENDDLQHLFELLKTFKLDFFILVNFKVQNHPLQ